MYSTYITFIAAAHSYSTFLQCHAVLKSAARLRFGRPGGSEDSLPISSVVSLDFNRPSSSSVFSRFSSENTELRDVSVIANITTATSVSRPDSTASLSLDASDSWHSAREDLSIEDLGGTIGLLDESRDMAAGHVNLLSSDDEFFPVVGTVALLYHMRIQFIFMLSLERATKQNLSLSACETSG